MIGLVCDIPPLEHIMTHHWYVSMCITHSLWKITDIWQSSQTVGSGYKLRCCSWYIASTHAHIVDDNLHWLIYWSIWNNHTDAEEQTNSIGDDELWINEHYSISCSTFVVRDFEVRDGPLRCLCSYWNPKECFFDSCCGLRSFCDSLSFLLFWSYLILFMIDMHVFVFYMIRCVVIECI